MSKEPSSDSRFRGWTFNVYPESAPANWRDILDSYHVPWCESPLHDLDVEDSGELKKAHIHVALTFEGKKSYDQILSLITPLSVSYAQRIDDLRGLIRYFAHLDDPAKHPYDPALIVGHCGFDPSPYLAPTATQRYEYIREMKDWCWREGVVEFQDLFDYAARERFGDWFPLLCDSSAYVMNLYLKSRRHSRSKEVSS